MRWLHLCEDANAPALAAELNDKALRSLRGRVLLSTDLLLGALVASDWSGWNAVAPGLIAAGGAFVMRLVLSMLRNVDRAKPIGKAVDWSDKNRKTLAGGLVALAVIGVLLVMSANDEEGFSIAGTALLVPALLWGATVIWHGVGFVERVVAEGLAWRTALDRLEFDRVVRSGIGPQAGETFGKRLGWLQRLQAIPAARRLERVEIAQRARPPRAPLFQRLSSLLSLRLKFNPGRGIWVALWILLAILRAMHSFGGH
jgi:hypothetical protein